MSGESRKKIRSIKASLDRLTEKTSSQFGNPSGGDFQWCEEGRDSCGNYTYCRTNCSGEIGDCTDASSQRYRKAKWMGGPGNFYACLDGYKDTNPDCHLQPRCKNASGVDMGPAPDPFYYFQHCKCNGTDLATGERIPVCCNCPESTHDPDEYTCECESTECHTCCDDPPPKECAHYVDARGDSPAQHGWVCDCDSVLQDVENRYGVNILPH